MPTPVSSGDTGNFDVAIGTITISYSFAPQGGTYQSGPDKTAAVSQQVKWVNGDPSENMFLNITGNPQGWDHTATLGIPPGSGFTFTFTSADRLRLRLRLLPHKVSGTITVSPEQ